MKPYFAKYLPVEGEVKHGDLYFQDKDTIGRANTERFGQPPYHYLHKKKAKLFLCSRDVQPHDIANENIQVHIHHDGSEPPFKVIGKISPEAIWVKEGEEFDEEQINIIYDKQFECKCEKPGMYRTPEQATCPHMIDDCRGGDFCVRQIEVIRHIQILCPTCKKFH